jgi:hypothetical protein
MAAAAFQRSAGRDLASSAPRSIAVATTENWHQLLSIPNPNSTEK